MEKNQKNQKLLPKLGDLLGEVNLSVVMYFPGFYEFLHI